jgi:hypothetical protein
MTVATRRSLRQMGVLLRDPRHLVSRCRRPVRQGADMSMVSCQRKKLSHHCLRLVRSLLRSGNSETLPNVLFQLPDVHAFCALCIVDKLWANASRLALRLGKQILLSWVGGPSQVAVKAVVEAGAIVVIVMEELGIEWNSAPFSS